MFLIKELLLMTIIKVTIPITQHKTVETHQHRNGQSTTYEYTEKKINPKLIVTEIKQCDYFCECSDDHQDSSSLCNSDLNDIKTILQGDDIDQDDKIKKISVILDQNILISLNTIINDRVSNDDTEYVDDKLTEAKKLLGITKSSDVYVARLYPFMVPFKQIGDKYEAQIHINAEKDNDKLFITYVTKEDGMSCGCCPSTYYNQVPLALSLSYPDDTNYMFEKFDHFIKFTKSYGNKTYNEHVLC